MGDVVDAARPREKGRVHYPEGPPISGGRPHKIIRVQYLSTGPQKFGMTRNLVLGKSLQVFEQKARERGAETNANYEFVMKDLISHSFSPKALQRQNRYLRRGLYKP